MDKMVKFFDYRGVFLTKRQEYMERIKKVLSSGYYILGPEVERFEINFAEYIGAKEAIGVGNGTDALLLALMAIGVGNGDEVISVSHTFIATIEVIHLLGAKPVLVDVADDHNMDVEQACEMISEKTKAIIPVQLNGRVCSRMDLLCQITDEKGIFLIEDAAQAVGAKFKGKNAGTFGHAGCFSFYPAKVLGAFGDAGAIVTNRKEIGEKIKKMRNHGRGANGVVEIWGLNSRLDSIHAATLIQSLLYLEEWIKKRREIAATYNSGLGSIAELRLPPPPAENEDHYDVYQNYEIEAEDRDRLKEYLEKKGIETAIQWGGIPVHKHPGLGFDDIELPKTEALFKKALLLPIYPTLEEWQVEYVIEEIHKFYGR